MWNCTVRNWGCGVALVSTSWKTVERWRCESKGRCIVWLYWHLHHIWSSCCSFSPPLNVCFLRARVQKQSSLLLHAPPPFICASSHPVSPLCFSQTCWHFNCGSYRLERGRTQRTHSCWFVWEHAICSSWLVVFLSADGLRASCGTVVTLLMLILWPCWTETLPDWRQLWNVSGDLHPLDGRLYIHDTHLSRNSRWAPSRSPDCIYIYSFGRLLSKVTYVWDLNTRKKPQIRLKNKCNKKLLFLVFFKVKRWV